MDDLPFKNPECVSATLPMVEILQKVKAAIEEEQAPIVISDWHLSAVWDKDLFSVDGILKHFNQFTHVGNSMFIFCCKLREEKARLMCFFQQQEQSKFETKTISLTRRLDWKSFSSYWAKKSAHITGRMKIRYREHGIPFWWSYCPKSWHFAVRLI